MSCCHSSEIYKPSQIYDRVPIDIDLDCDYVAQSSSDFIAEASHNQDDGVRNQEKKPTTLYKNCILRNNCSPPLSVNKIPEIIKTTTTECEQDFADVIDSFKQIPRNRLCAYKVFRNSTFKFVSPGGQSLINNSNNSNKRSTFNGANCSNSMDLYINKVNKSIMMKKITELARPYYDKKTVVKEFKRIIPHPIIDDERFRARLDAAVSQEISSNNLESNFTANTDAEIVTEKISENTSVPVATYGSIDEYEQMLIKKLSEIRQYRENPKKEVKDADLSTEIAADAIFGYQLEDKKISKERPKIPNSEIGKSKEKISESIFAYQLDETKQCKESVRKQGHVVTVSKDKTPESIFAYHSNPGSTESVHDHKSVTLRRRTQSYNANQAFIGDNGEKCELITSHKRKIILPVVPIMKLSTNSEINSKMDTVDDNNTNKSTNKMPLENEIEVSIDDLNVDKEIVKEDNSHIPLYFKYASGKKIRFKIRYRGKMGQAFKAFFTRMNVAFGSEIVFTTLNGVTVASSDTPQSLHLKSNDIIIVSNI